MTDQIALAVTLTPETARRMVALNQACVYMLDYHPPGHKVSWATRMALAALIGRDVHPADAAEIVQSIEGAPL